MIPTRPGSGNTPLDRDDAAADVYRRQDDETHDLESGVIDEPEHISVILAMWWERWGGRR